MSGTAKGTRFTYRSMMGGRVAVVATGKDDPASPTLVHVRVASRKNGIYPYGMEMWAGKTFLSKR